MKKIIAFLITAILYLTPLVAFSQKNSRSAAQPKSGVLTINVEYNSQRNIEINGKDGDKTTGGGYVEKLNIKYTLRRDMKLLAHDGFVSIVDLGEPTADGNFSFSRTGQKSTTGSDSNREEREKDEFSGKITDGQATIETPDQGDGITSVSISASGKGSGSCERTLTENGETSKRDCSVYSSSDEAKISTERAEDDANTIPVEVNQESRRSKKFNAAGSWSPYVSTGSFAAGGYQFLSKGKQSPADEQKDADGEKVTFTETVSITGTLTLGAGNKTAMLSTPEKTDGFEQAFALLSKSYNFVSEDKNYNYLRDQK